MKESVKYSDSRVLFRLVARTSALGLGCFCLFLLTLPRFAFSAAIVVRGNLSFNGNGVVVDSFNSSDPTKSTNGLYDPTKAGDNGDVYAGFSYTSSVAIGNAEVYGTLITGPSNWISGPTAFLSLGTDGAVGTHSWQTNGGTGIEPGFFDTTNLVVEDVAVPNASSFPTPIAGTVVTQNGPPATQAFSTQANLPTLGPGQSFVSITTNTTMVTTTNYPGPLPGLTSNLTFLTVAYYPGDVPNLTTDCVSFVTVTNDPGPQPCLSSVDVVTNTTADYPGPIPGLVTNTFITPPCLTTNFVCSDPITSSNLPDSWCAADGIQTNCAGSSVFTHTFPAPGTWCESEGVVTNFRGDGIEIIGYTYYPVAGYTYTTNAIGDITYSTNYDCPGSTNYVYSYLTGSFTYADQSDYTWLVTNYSYPQTTSYNYTLYSAWTYETNFYDAVLSGGNYVATSLGNTIVTGPSTLVLANGYSIGLLTIVPGGSLTVYVQGSSCVIYAESIANQTGLASNLQILCAPSVTSLTMEGLGSVPAVVDAPEANTILTGAGGNGALDFSGTLLVNSLTANGHVRVHYDEAFGQLGYLVFPAMPTQTTLYPGFCTNGQFQVFVENAEPGDKCVVETSTDLINWVPVFTNTVWVGFTYVDTNWVGLSQNFYRTIYVQ